jgi:putative transposase
MPNHFHLVVWPREDGELSRFLHVLTTTHVRRYHMKYGTSGRIWQERFKSFPIQQDEHLLRVLRYVERNPVRAALVHLAADWPWSSVHWWRTGNWPEYADPGPVPRPEEWDSLLTGDEQPAEVEMLRRHVERGRPFGERGWIEGTAMALRLTQTLRDRGRPGRCREEKGASPLL